jgi:DNA-binding CsgD family transcriptional regulator
MISPPVRSQTFFGRDKELAVLRASVDAARSGEPACVLIRGERGSGKTRLVDELRFNNSDTGFEIVRCHVGDGAQRVAGALRDARTRKALGIVLEDADRAGSAILDALASYDDVSLLWIVTISPTAEPSEEFELAVARLRMRGAYEITLGPLDDESMRRIVAAFRVHGVRLTRERVSRVVHLAGGNPGLATEITRTFLATPVPEGTPVPDAMLAAARVNLEKLTSGDRDVVLIAAIIGANFTVEVLCEIAEVRQGDVVSALQHASSIGVVRESARGTFAFAHPLLHEAVRLQCTPTWAAQYHARIAAKLAQHTGDLADGEDSARHFAASGETQRAADTSDRIGSAYLAKRSFLHAARNFRRASQLHADDTKRGNALVQLADTLRRGGFDEEALRVYEELVADTRLTFAPDVEAGILMGLMQLLWGRSEMERANQIARRILAIELPPHNSIKPTLLVKLAGFAAGAARFSEVFELLQELKQHEPLDASTRAHVAQIRGFAVSATESFNAALPSLLESIDLVDSAGDVNLASLFRRNFGTLALSHGYTPLALEMLERSFQLSLQANSESFLEATAASYADALARCGRLNEAREVLDRVDARTSDFGGVKDYFIVATMLEIGSMLDDRELVARALEWEEQLVEGALRSGESQRIASVVTAFAAHYWCAGNAERAQSLLSQAVARVESVQWNQRFCVLAARCAYEADIPKARSLLIRDSSTAGRIGDGYVALFDAFEARRSGKGTVAARHGKTAAARFADVGWPLLEAQALEAAGDHVGALRLYELAGDVRDAALLRNAMRPRGGARAHAVGLTDRERTIASLAAQGLSNKEIAERLAVGVRTVEFHLQSVYSKLGIKSRWQLPHDLLTP